MSEYDFTSLSPSDFEVLVRDLLSAEYGVRFEAFAYGPDGGVDLRGTIDDVKTIVQCKHYAGSKFPDLKKAAAHERAKMLVEAPQRYIFATTQNLTRMQKDCIHGILDGLPVSLDDILCRTDINYLLGLHPAVEKRHFKLWLASTTALQSIVNSGVWERSEAMLESVQSRVRLYVSNASYGRASTLLEDRRIVTITGAPGVGKSMLADMLILAHWNEGWQIVTISEDVNEGWSSWQKGAHQVFLYDDFLGQTDISERSQGKNEGANLSRFIERVSTDSTKRLVLTTRSHILQQAKIRNEPLARSRIDTWQCVVEVADFSVEQRSRVLYNHLYFSSQSRDVIREFVGIPNLVWSFVNHVNFSPRIIEQALLRPHESGYELAAFLRGAFDRPLDLWGPSFENTLSEVARSILLVLVSFPIAGADGLTLKKIAAIGSTPIEYRHALKVLEGSWIRIELSRFQVPVVRFANPSCRDFILSFLDSNPEYLTRLIAAHMPVRNICQLFAYAASESSESSIRKYPGLQSCLKESKIEIGEIAHDTIRRDVFGDGRVECVDIEIATLELVNRKLSLGWNSWLFELAVTFGRTSGRRYAYNFEATSRVVAFLSREVSGREREEIDLTSIGRWASGWVESVTCDDELAEINVFCKRNRGSLIVDKAGLLGRLIDSAEQWFGDELESFGPGEGLSVSELRERIDEIKKLSDEIGIREKLADRISAAEQWVTGYDSYEPTDVDLEEMNYSEFDEDSEGRSGGLTVDFAISGDRAPAENLRDSIERTFRQLQ